MFEKGNIARCYRSCKLLFTRILSCHADLLVKMFLKWNYIIIFYLEGGEKDYVMFGFSIINHMMVEYLPASHLTWRSLDAGRTVCHRKRHLV